MENARYSRMRMCVYVIWMRFIFQFRIKLAMNVRSHFNVFEIVSYSLDVKIDKLAVFARSRFSDQCSIWTTQTERNMVTVQASEHVCNLKCNECRC